jgi:hypothetical protein
MGRVVSLTTGQFPGVHYIILVVLKSRVGSAEEMNPCPFQEANHKSSVQPVAHFAIPTVLYLSTSTFANRKGSVRVIFSTRYVGYITVTFPSWKENWK